MDLKNKRILETLQMQPLSEEEKASRHILGRLYGPIATCKEKTRNGRGYNKELWERALSDEIFKEKLATKSLFLELGHPADREETDMTCVCACIPEMPKIVNDDLYAYVDILDTPNGRLLKTLCDYGFVPGISSRGSGDIMENDEVDPETFFLETWDIVQLPAVKKARLQMTESLNNKKSLKAVLQESYNSANDKDKKIMKKSLENLNIKLDEAAGFYPAGTPIEPAPIPQSQIEDELIKTSDNITEEDNLKILQDDSKDKKEKAELIEAKEKASEEEPVDDKAIDEPSDEEPVEEPSADEPTEEPSEDGFVEETSEAATVGDFIDELKDYDNELSLEWKPIVIDGKEYPIEAVAFDSSEDGKVIAEVSYTLPEEEVTINDEDAVAEEPAEEEQEATTDEADDIGEDEVIECLKEAVRQKDLLDNEVKDLKNQKAVSDAKVNELNEALKKYKNGFIRVSELASKSTSFERANKALTEQLNLKNAQIKDLETKLENHKQLTEGIDVEKLKVKQLSNKVINLQNELRETEKSLTEELEASKKKATYRTELAKSYKAKYDAVVERYIANKAKMLGVRTTDITSKLNENYSLDDIDNVCKDLLTEGRPQFSLAGGNPRIRVNEAVNKPEKKLIDPDNGYEIDDDLLILAGLKD